MGRELPDVSEGDRVYVIDSGFEGGVIHLGTVENVYGGEVDVRFSTDPYNDLSVEKRTITVMAEQIVPTDASTEFVYTLIGLEDLL